VKFAKSEAGKNIYFRTHLAGAVPAPFWSTSYSLPLNGSKTFLAEAGRLQRITFAHHARTLPSSSHQLSAH
jgi:hypothetical protein